MKTLAIDIETYSSVSLQKCGVYAYAESPDFDILLFGYAVDDGPVEVIDLTPEGAELPDWIIEALYDPEWQKTAFNAQFERTCISKYLGLQNNGAARRSWLPSLACRYLLLRLVRS